MAGDTLQSESLQIPAGKSLDQLDEKTQVLIWKERIRLGVKWRERTSGRNDSLWSRFKRFYRGDWWGDKYQFDDTLFDPQTQLASYVPTNRMFAYVRALLPNIYFRNPGIYVNKGLVIPGPDGKPVDDRQVVQDGADYLTRELKIKREIKKTVLTTLLTGTGIVQEGFGSQFKVDDSGEEVTGNKLEYASSIKPGLPWIKNINPSDFVLPWGCKDFNDTPWCAVRAWRRIEDTRNDSLYEHKDKLKATAKPNTAGDKSKGAEMGQPANWVELWEIRDIQTGQIMIVSDGSDLFHYKDEDVLQIEHFPIHMLVFNEDPDSCWGISDLKIMEPQQLELNDARTHEAAYRRRLLSEVLMDPAGIVDEKSQARLVNASNPAKAVLINKPRENIMQLTTSIPPDIAAAGERIDNDIRHEIGQGRNQGGEANTGRRTAKEVSIVDRSAQLRNDERRDITADFVGDIMNTVMQISFKIMPEQMIKRITGGQLWHKRDPETLPYDLGLEVNAEETRQLDRAGVANGLLSLHERLRGDPVIDPIALTRMILEGLKNIGLPITPGQLINPQIAQIVAALIEQQQGQGEEQ